ncbi:MAG: PA0069 family radical SAM protein [Planctomycetaceae bacterium]|nr:PA0069 family radical SAM protein [Planctomycetaceae bacterium]
MRHGSNLNPPNRFESIHREADLEHFEWDQEYLRELSHRRVEYIDDASRSIISENTSPDIPFRYSINPYRGCAHACSYCYARPSHEYLGLDAGLDFETRIVVKHNAAQLFRDFLSNRKWKPEPITFSGVTDCYQPVERELRITRQCLEVALECRQPVNIITKNALVLRDLEILKQLAARNLVHVFLSITSLNPELARDMEPRTSIPAARLRAVRMLSESGVPVGVMTAPVIPGLNDSEIPGLLSAAKEAGAISASYILLRLPLTVEPVFIEWLQRVLPAKADMILGRIRETRDGQMNSAAFGERMRGTGIIAEQIRNMFHLFRQRNLLEARLPPLNCDLFRPPADRSGQLRLF